MPRARGRRRDLIPVTASSFEGSFPQLALVVLIALKALVLIAAFDPSVREGFELTKAQLGRALAWPMAAALLVGVVRHGTGILPRSRLHGFVAAYLLAVAVSAVFAEVPYLAIYGERGNYFGLTFHLDMAVLYLAAAVSLRRLSDFTAVLAGIALGLAIDVAYSALQFTGLDPVRWGIDVRRPIGTFGSAVRHAHFLAVAFAMAVAIALLAPAGRWRRTLRTAGLGSAFLILALAGVVASRGFFVGLVGGSLALGAVLWASRRYPTTRLLQAGAAIVVLTGLALALLITTPAGQRVGARIAELAAEERLLIYDVALDAFAARPITGYGPDSFPVGYTRNRGLASITLGANVIENSAHNWLLQASVTTGAVGALALLALLFTWIGQLPRAFARSPVVGGAIAAAGGAYWLQGLVSVGTNSVDWFAWVTFGAVAALAADPRPAPARSAWAWPWGVPIAAAFALAVTVVPALDASRAAHLAAAGFEQKVQTTAEDAAREAVRSDPGRADHWNWLGLALTMRQAWREAADAFQEAAARAPYDSTYWQNLARSRALQSLAGDASAGGPDAVSALIRRAIAAEPVERSNYETGAELLYSLGRPEMALELAVEGHARSGFLVSDDLVRRASKVVQDNTRARAAIEALLGVRESDHFRVALARVALAMGDVATARVNVARALQLQPANQEAVELMARIGP